MKGLQNLGTVIKEALVCSFYEKSQLTAIRGWRRGHSVFGADIANDFPKYEMPAR